MRHRDQNCEAPAPAPLPLPPPSPPDDAGGCPTCVAGAAAGQSARARPSCRRLPENRSLHRTLAAPLGDQGADILARRRPMRDRSPSGRSRRSWTSGTGGGTGCTTCAPRRPTTPHGPRPFRFDPLRAHYARNYWAYRLRTRPSARPVEANRESQANMVRVTPGPAPPVESDRSFMSQRSRSSTTGQLRQAMSGIFKTRTSRAKRDQARLVEAKRDRLDAESDAAVPRRFDGRVRWMPFPDHHPPTLRQMRQFCYRLRRPNRSPHFRTQR